MTQKENQTNAWSEVMGIVLFISAILSVIFFIDWSLGPMSTQVENYENCVAAERLLGDSIYQERPNCRDILEAVDSH